MIMPALKRVLRPNFQGAPAPLDPGSYATAITEQLLQRIIV